MCVAFRNLRRSSGWRSQWAVAPRESVWPANLLQEIPTVIGEGGRKKFLVANGQEMGHDGRKKIKFGGETGRSPQDHGKRQ